MLAFTGLRELLDRDQCQCHVMMPAFPGPHLVRVHARFPLAPFEARFNAGTRCNHACQFP
jgi:hypothetical protein